MSVKAPALENGHEQATQEKNKAAIQSVFWSGFLTFIKLFAGVFTGSLGLISEALHSALDLLAALITCFAVRVSAQPADAMHPFGHGKVEHLSALAETALLFITCGWIVGEAINRLFFNPSEVTVTWWAIAIIVVSLLVDVNRSAMLRKVAKKHKSQALEADALHFTTDIWSSAVVLCGLLTVYFSQHVTNPAVQHILHKADAVAALGVAFIVLGVSWNLGKRAVIALMDGGGEVEAEKIRHALINAAPIYPVSRVRVRESGADYFVDITLEIPSTVRIDAAHAVADELEEVVHQLVPNADITMHLEPMKGFI